MGLGGGVNISYERGTPVGSTISSALPTEPKVGVVRLKAKAEPLFSDLASTVGSTVRFAMQSLE